MCNFIKQSKRCHLALPRLFDTVVHTHCSGLPTNSHTHLQRDHIRFVLLPDAQVVHEELQHVEGLFFAHVQQQHSSYEADTLTVANLRRAKTQEHSSFHYVFYDTHHNVAQRAVMQCGQKKQDGGWYLCIQQRVGF